MANYHPCVQMWLYPPHAGIQTCHPFEIWLENIPTTFPLPVWEPQPCLQLPKGCLSSIRHNRMRDIVVEFLTEVCPNVSTEPALQPITGETFSHRSTDTDDGARLDITAQNLLVFQLSCTLQLQDVISCLLSLARTREEEDIQKEGQ